MYTPEITIPGVDVQAGLDLYDDDMDIYLPVLRSYSPNAAAVLEKLRIVTRETLAEYAISVHGLKSISANIGATIVYKGALELEQKAKAGDLDGVLAGNDTLIKNAQMVITGVQTWLTEHDSQAPKPTLARPDPALLARLYQCSTKYDMQGAEEIMNQLESNEYNADGSLIPWLREKINESDFSSITERLAAYGENSHG